MHFRLIMKEFVPNRFLLYTPFFAIVNGYFLTVLYGYAGRRMYFLFFFVTHLKFLSVNLPFSPNSNDLPTRHTDIRCYLHALQRDKTSLAQSIYVQ